MITRTINCALQWLFTQNVKTLSLNCHLKQMSLTCKHVPSDRKQALNKHTVEING